MGCNTDGGPKAEAVRGTSDDDTQNITSDVKKNLKRYTELLNNKELHIQRQTIKLYRTMEQYKLRIQRQTIKLQI